MFQSNRLIAEMFAPVSASRAMGGRWMKQCAVALVTALFVATGPAVAEDAVNVDSTQADVALVKASKFAPDDVGYFVIDLADNRVVAQHNADRPFIPASVAKIPAVAAGLEILGSDYRFATTVLADGEISDGVLAGSLTLRGGGDPFLSSDDLQTIAKALAASGIKKVEGSFFYDASALIEVPQINDMQPEAAGYNTGVSALSVNFNRVRLNWNRGRDPSSAFAAAISESRALPLDGVAIAFAAEEPPGPFVRAGTPSEDRWLLAPSLPETGEDWLPVGDPSLVTAEVFKALAAEEGVDLPDPKPGVTPEGARALVNHDSIPLGEIASGVLHYSNNLSAELIGLAASQRLTGRRLSLKDSATALAAWWKLRRPEADWTDFAVENHSGLSSRSRTTPRQIVTMLEESSELMGGADFNELLKQIQWKGVNGWARVKTGTMSYARGLAGYINTESGGRLAFAIFFNDVEKRAALDEAFDRHVRAIDGASRSWRNSALRLEETLTTGWAKRF